MAGWIQAQRHMAHAIVSHREEWTPVRYPKAIFFDLDDTLIDDCAATQAAVDQFFDHVFGDRQADQYQRWSEALKIYCPQFLNGGISAIELQRSRMCYVLQDDSLPDQKADELFSYFLDRYVDNTTRYPETIDALNELQAREIKLGMITNGPEEMQQRKITAAGLRSYFQPTMTAERAGVGKPNPRIFDLTLREAGYQREDCWYVGDSVENDALASQQFGMTGILLQRSEPGSINNWHLGDKGAQQSEFDGVTITSLRELLEQVARAC